MDWETLGKEISTVFHETHLKSKRMSIEKRLTTVKKFFDQLVQKVKGDPGIKEYIKEKYNYNNLSLQVHNFHY